jgi:hypothetical protein
MNNKPTGAIKGSGNLEWSMYAWWGSAIGATCWMLIVAGFLAFFGQPILSLTPISIFSAINSIAYLLWSRRDRIKPFTAMIALLLSLSVAFPLVWYVVEFNANVNALAAMNWPKSVFARVSVSIIAPLGMVLLWLQEQ